MSRNGITYEEVKKAIAELQGRQRNPTVDAIREILGTGSKSTIARHLRSWKTQHGLENEQAGLIPSDLLGMVNGLWETLKSKADDQINQYRQEFDNAAQQLQQQLIQARQQESNLRQNIHALEEQLHQRNEEFQQLSTSLMNETQEKIRYSERVSTLELCRQENIKENQRLHQLLKHVQENLEHYQSAIQELRQEQTILIEKQQNEYEQRLMQQLDQLHKITNEKVTLQAKCEQLTSLQTSLTTDYKTLLNHHAEKNCQFDSLKTSHDKLQDDHENLKDQYQLNLNKFKSQEEVLIKLQLTLPTKIEKISFLEDALAKANDKIEVLRHDNQFTFQEKSNLEGQLKQLQLILTKTQIYESCEK